MTYTHPLKSWPAHYKARTIEIHESHRHQVWIASLDVKKILPSLRSDSQLARVYSTDFRSLDKSKRVFFSERALKKELQYNRSQDALMFLAWLEKNVYYPAARKRGDADALKPMPERMQDEDDGQDGEGLHIPIQKLPPTPKPQHIQKKVVRHPDTTSLGKRYIHKPFLALWRGEVEMSRTIVFCGLVMVAWIVATGFLIDMVTSPTHYTGSYVWRQWLVLLLLLSLGVAVAWWCIGIMRCAIRRQHEGRSFRASLAGFVFGLTLLFYLIPIPLAAASEWMEGWWGTVHGELQAAEVIHDKFLGRIVIRGELGFGTYKRLEAALKQTPVLTLVEIDSPGGYVVEGLAMARLLEKAGADTASLEECASSCTFLLAAGKERYLGPKSEIGFHRSFSRSLGFGKGWSSTDHRIADYYRSRGTEEAFVKRALDTPGYDLWIPTHGQMFSAGYATKRWDERKAGY
jgi:hypothetical protein